MSKLKLNVYAVVSRAVEEGARYGYQRAFKHSDKPSREHIEEQIARAIMSELSAVINWDWEDAE